jgi:hypothetical protein
MGPLDHRYADGATRAQFALELRRAYALGATPTQLLEQISAEEGRPLGNLEFEVIVLMKAAFCLSLSDGIFAISSPRGQIRTIATDDEFDDAMSDRIEFARPRWEGAP